MEKWPDAFTNFDALRVQTAARLFLCAVEQEKRCDADPSHVTTLASRSLYWADCILREVQRTPWEDAK